MEKELLKFLTYYKIVLPTIEAERYLIAHPHYPSLLSLHDTLSLYGIENEAKKIELNQALAIQIPFIAYFESGGGEFKFMKNGNQFKDLSEWELESWNGVILYVSNIDLSKVKSFTSLFDHLIPKMLDQVGVEFAPVMDIT
ncbi:MAG: hypothetical protein AAF600_15400 [Bacteroidota bacterium]